MSDQHRSLEEFDNSFFDNLPPLSMGAGFDEYLSFPDHQEIVDAPSHYHDNFGIQSVSAQAFPGIVDVPSLCDNFYNQSIPDFFQDSFLQQEHLLNRPNDVSNNPGCPQVEGSTNEGETCEYIDVASVTTWTPIGFITTQYLIQLYGKTRAEAAEILQVSVPTFKRICRKHGIPRWPYVRRRLVPPCQSRHVGRHARC